MRKEKKGTMGEICQCLSQITATLYQTYLHPDALDYFALNSLLAILNQGH